MRQQGKLYVIGIGPGSMEGMTQEARAAIEVSDVLIGYTVYIDLIKDEFPHKETVTTPMKQEVERCRLALSMAEEGKTVSMICSGDSGVYGMSGLVLELAGGYQDPEIQIIPGVTAACAGAARLGAPLCHDFAVISLSDLLTPMELIRTRISCAAMGDFVICLYNPSSKKRGDYLREACDLVLAHQRPETVCGVVRNIGREGEESKLLSLMELRTYQADMFTTVFIGNSHTKIENGRMVTPRGYGNV